MRTDPRLLITIAVATACLGLLAQKTAGALPSALAVQAAGLVLGGIVALAIGVSRWRPDGRGAVAIVAIATLAVLATFTDPGGGAQRWAMIGPIAIQPSAVVLPFVVWGWSRVRATWLLAGLTSALAVMMAAQPDAAACGGLLLALVAVGVTRGSMSLAEGTTIVVTLAATVWAATRPDDLPAVPWVERVVVEAFAASPAIGIAAGLAMIAVPGLMFWRAWSASDDAMTTALALAGLWLGLTVAALVANYPVPVVGYGASSAIGWLMSLGLCLQKVARIESANPVVIEPRA